MRTYYIYKITNVINGKCYIGQHEVPLNQESFNRYFGKGVAIQAAIKKYGKENFKKEILEYIDDDDKHEKVSEREKYWIKKEQTMYPTGYNISPGGEGGITSEVAKRSAKTRKEHGYTLSEETKQKISTSNKGKKKSEEHRKHLSENHHLRRLIRIQHEDGTIEETRVQIYKIAEQYGTNHNTLIRHSAKREFVNGIYLLDISPEDYQCCNYKKYNDQNKVMCIDPVVRDVCTLSTIKSRRRRNKEAYENIVLNDCIITEDEK